MPFNNARGVARKTFVSHYDAAKGSGIEKRKTEMKRDEKRRWEEKRRIKINRTCQ